MGDSAEAGCSATPDDEADVAKSEFTVVDAPARLDVGVPADVTVRATLVNNGPFVPAQVTDVIEADVPADCTVSPASYEISTALAVGAPQTFERTFTVSCANPSFHEFTFLDRLRVGSDGVVDPSPENNSASARVTIPVFGDSDVVVENTALECTDATTVDTDFVCTGRTQVRNNGPFGPTDADAALGLSAPADCSVTALSGSDQVAMPIGVGGVADLERSWTVSCTNRSYHSMQLDATAAVNHLHVEDHVTANDAGSATDVVEVFEDVDLETVVTDLRCSEREANMTSSECVATVAVTNNGPATAVQTLTDVTFDVAPDCVATPAGSQTTQLTLDAGQTATVTAGVSVACTLGSRHAVGVQAVLHNAPTDPHAVDNDTAFASWLPSDTKPRSLPSSINLRKVGDVPFAVLATAEFDPLTDLVISSLRYGVTGTEDSVVRCGLEGEDVNDDGLRDLVCQASTPDTGVALGTTVLMVTGVTVDGVPFFSQDDVNVVGG